MGRSKSGVQWCVLSRKDFKGGPPVADKSLNPRGINPGGEGKCLAYRGWRIRCGV